VSFSKIKNQKRKQNQKNARRGGELACQAEAIDRGQAAHGKTRLTNNLKENLHQQRRQSPL